MKIKYYDGARILEIEVTEIVANGYQEIKREQWRRRKSTSKYEGPSMDALEENGIEFSAEEIC